MYSAILLASLLLSAADTPADAAPATDGAAKDQVTALVKQLDARELTARDEAERKLLERARPCCPCCRASATRRRLKWRCGSAACSRNCSSASRRRRRAHARDAQGHRPADFRRSSPTSPSRPATPSSITAKPSARKKPIHTSA